MKRRYYQFAGIILYLLVIGYLGQLFTAFYRTTFTANIDEIEFTEVTVDCSSRPGVCTRTYEFNLPRKDHSNQGLVVGNVLNPSQWYCGGKLRFLRDDPRKLVTSRQNFNEYFVLQGAYIADCSSGAWTVKLAHPQSQKKIGFRSSNFLLTSQEIAEKIKAANEFVSRDYKILNLCLVTAILLFSFLIRVVSLDPLSNVRTKLSLLLFVGAVAQSRVLEVFLPFDFFVPFGQWLPMLAYCGYLIYCLKYFLKDKDSSLTINLSVLMFFGILLVTQDRIASWIWFSFGMSFVLACTGLKNRNYKLILTSTLAFITSFEFYGVLGLPNSYIVPSYLGAVILLENLQAFLSFLKINRILKLSLKRKTKSGDAGSSRHELASVVKVFQKLFSVEKVTVLNITNSDSLHLMQFDSCKHNPLSNEISELTPVFAHVCTTGNQLLNVDPGSKLIQSLRRGDVREDDSSSFTVVPLFSGQSLVGAVSLSRYPQGLFGSSLSTATFLHCLEIFKSMIVEQMLSVPLANSLDRISTVNKLQESVEGEVSSEAILEKFAQHLHESFGWRVLSGNVCQDSFQLQQVKCVGFNPEIAEQIYRGKLYAHKDNQQGPLALAVHEKKPVIVPNTKWLEGVVHPNTTKFFNVHGTKTAAFIPLVDDAAGSVVGVLWIEGSSQHEISHSDRELFSGMMQVLASKLKHLKSSKRIQHSQKGLSQFIPSAYVEDYLAGKKVSENDFGYLLMLDLKGSTRLAHEIGNDNFHTEVEKLKHSLVETLKGYNWILQQFVWDGFEFTLSCSEEDEANFEVSFWLALINPVIESWKAALIADYGNSSEISQLSFRLCFTFGDTSRGIVEEGSTQKWALTGNAIAVVTKVEQASKALGGVVFCDRSMLSRSAETWEHLTTTSQGIEVYGNPTVRRNARKAA